MAPRRPAGHDDLPGRPRAQRRPPFPVRPGGMAEPGLRHGTRPRPVALRPAGPDPRRGPPPGPAYSFSRNPAAASCGPPYSGPADGTGPGAGVRERQAARCAPAGPCRAGEAGNAVRHVRGPSGRRATCRAAPLTDRGPASGSSRAETCRRSAYGAAATDRPPVAPRTGGGWSIPFGTDPHCGRPHRHEGIRGRRHRPARRFPPPPGPGAADAACPAPGAERRRSPWTAAARAARRGERRRTAPRTAGPRRAAGRPPGRRPPVATLRGRSGHPARSLRADARGAAPGGAVRADDVGGAVGRFDATGAAGRRRTAPKCTARRRTLRPAQAHEGAARGRGRAACHRADRPTAQHGPRRAPSRAAAHRHHGGHGSAPRRPHPQQRHRPLPDTRAGPAGPQRTSGRRATRCTQCRPRRLSGPGRKPVRPPWGTGRTEGGRSIGYRAGGAAVGGGPDRGPSRPAGGGAARRAALGHHHSPAGRPAGLSPRLCARSAARGARHLAAPARGGGDRGPGGHGDGTDRNGCAASTAADRAQRPGARHPGVRHPGT